MEYKPIMRGQRRSFRRHLSDIGKPKYEVGDKIGHFEIIRYEGHSEINKRNAQHMSKSQHWYRCRCICGNEEHRSQQELVDPRREQKCFHCRNAHLELKEEQ